MEVEIRLKKVLQDYGLDRHGIAQEIAKAIGVHRHTLSRLYNNEMKNPPLDVIGKVCEYLAERGVPKEELPQALFGAKPSGLWNALRSMEKVTLYLGEYQRTDVTPPQMWISRRDAYVATQIDEHLAKSEGPRPKVHFEYVPFRISPQAPPEQAAAEFGEDKAYAQRKFEEAIRGRTRNQGTIMIGSQKVNNIAELFVADLFHCTPFPPPGERTRVPFYFVYRQRGTYDRDVSSCFGGTELPGAKGKAEPGAYYRDANGKWIPVPWVLDAKDAGVVIVVYDGRIQTIALAVMGFSGRATLTIGKQLIQKGDLFWPPTAESKGRRVGVYICEMEFVQTVPYERDETLHLKSFKAIPLNEERLEKLLT